MRTPALFSVTDMAILSCIPDFFYSLNMVVTGVARRSATSGASKVRSDSKPIIKPEGESSLGQIHLAIKFLYLILYCLIETVS